MTYIRLLGGFSVSNFAHGESFKTSAYSGEIWHHESGVRVCSFSQDGKGQPTEILWGSGTDDYRLGLALLGLRHSNDDAAKAGDEIFIRADIEADPVLLDRLAAFGIEILCEDYCDDKHYQRLAHKQIFVRTTRDNVYTALGVYDPERRRSIREEFNALLKNGEEVVEVINERYVLKTN